MNPSNNSQSNTLTASISNYGNLSLTDSESMDVDADGQRSSEPANVKDKDLMETTLDHVPTAPKHVGASEGPLSDVGVAPTQDHNPILERPRDDEAGTQQSQSQAPSIPQRSPLTQNLLSMFGLHPLAATVARTDPVTGEKINKMRKSYEGQLKTLGLSGRNRAVKHEEGKGMGLKELSMWPEEEWRNQKVGGKDVQKGLTQNMLAKLDKAMQMQPGPIPNNNEWEDLLGHEKPKPAEQNPKASKPQNVTTVRTNVQVNGTTANAEAVRPKRTGRKRRYDEHSFEGYGEGFLDDDVDAGGYTSGETHASRKSGSSKKRKKDYGNSPTGFGDRATAFGSNMVGVTAYGR